MASAKTSHPPHARQTSAKRAASPESARTTCAQHRAPSQPAARETSASHYAERAVLIPVGAALTARDRVVSSVNDTFTNYSSTSRAQAQLRKFERRGATARKRFEREVRKARTSVERELRKRRQDERRVRATASRSASRAWSDPPTSPAPDRGDPGAPPIRAVAHGTVCRPHTSPVEVGPSPPKPPERPRSGGFFVDLTRGGRGEGAGLPQ